MSRVFVLSDRERFLFEVIFKFKCLNYEQILFFTDYNFSYLRTRMNEYKKLGLVDDVYFENKKYWFLKNKALRYINVEIRNTKPSFSIINHTSIVVDTVIYLMKKYPDYSYQSEREYIQENFNNFRRNKGVPDILVFDENDNLVYVVEVEITRKQKSIFDKKVTEIYRSFLMRNEGSKILWIIHNNFKNFEERLSDNKRLSKKDYDILFVEDLSL